MLLVDNSLPKKVTRYMYVLYKKKDQTCLAAPGVNATKIKCWNTLIKRCFSFRFLFNFLFGKITEKSLCLSILLCKDIILWLDFLLSFHTLHAFLSLLSLSHTHTHTQSLSLILSQYFYNAGRFGFDFDHLHAATCLSRVYAAWLRAPFYVTTWLAALRWGRSVENVLCVFMFVISSFMIHSRILWRRTLEFLSYIYTECFFFSLWNVR